MILQGHLIGYVHFPSYERYKLHLSLRNLSFLDALVAHNILAVTVPDNTGEFQSVKLANLTRLDGHLVVSCHLY